MGRILRSPLCLSIWWTCAFIFVFAYILFDLLDVDGSGFQAAMAGSRAAEEKIVDENAGKRIPTGIVGPWPPSPRSLSVALSWLCITLAPISTVRRPSLKLRRPRSLITKQQTATTQPESDPSRRTS